MINSLITLTQLESLFTKHQPTTILHPPEKRNKQMPGEQQLTMAKIAELTAS